MKISKLLLFYYFYYYYFFHCLSILFFRTIQQTILRFWQFRCDGGNFFDHDGIDGLLRIKFSFIILLFLFFFYYLLILFFSSPTSHLCTSFKMEIRPNAKRNSSLRYSIRRQNLVEFHGRRCCS
jgi:hypothetical protein